METSTQEFCSKNCDIEFVKTPATKKEWRGKIHDLRRRACAPAPKEKIPNVREFITIDHAELNRQMIRSNEIETIKRLKQESKKQ